MDTRPRENRPRPRPISRQERIADLARQITDGTYYIPAEWVAESILSWRGRAGRRN